MVQYGWDDLDEPAPAVRPKIVTNFWMKPIPLRQFDWEAWRDGDEPNDAGGMMVGHGATEAEAIADLEMQLEGD